MIKGQDYVLGFAFSNDNKRVALIKKNRPAWQKDKYNGIGGKIIENEQPIQAMIREFKEETGVEEYGFQEFAKLDFSTGYVFCYKVNTNLDLLQSVTDEYVATWSPYNLPPNLVNDVRWLVTLALTGLNFYEIKVYQQ